MFQFGKEQKIFDIASVKVGGQPGQLPTVMMGSIFYYKHNIVTNEKTGEFDRKKAEELLQKEGEISNYTGKPRIVDVCCSWPAAFEKFIEFVANKTNCPISIDGTTAEVRIAGAKYVGEVGLSDRVIYNSITPHTKEEELSAIKEAKIKSAILLTLNTKNPTINGRLEVIDDLLNIAQKAGIEKFLIDATVMDIPDPGLVSKVIYFIKEKYGLPAGAGAHNAVDRLRGRRKLNYIEQLIASNTANILPIVMGANFVLYGPIENHEWVYFGCALADAWVSYSIMQEYKMRPSTKDHPLFKIFR
ncbi:TPA: tetrahydromethanopterin S-methyltransferase subunit H [Candidatus Poribacteria bacterium]|nr:tetrahydromethanopterin S-methyltransferase subunit H [Candidatus Poribacteria bacterium]